MATAPITEEDVRAAMAQTGQDVQAMLEASAAGVAATAAGSQVISEGLQIKSLNDQVISMQQQLSQLNTQLTTQQASLATGGTEAQTARIAVQQKEADQITRLLQEKEDIISQEITGIGLIDGIINDFRTIQVDSEIDIAQDQHAHAVRTIQNAAASVENIGRQAAITANTQTAGTVAAVQNNIKVATDIQVAEQRIATAKNNAEAATSVANASSAVAQNQLKMLQLQNTEADRTRRDEDLERTKTIQKAETQTKEAMDEDMRVGMAAAGVKVPPSGVAIGIYNGAQDSNTRNVYGAFLALGSQQKTGSGVRFGATPATAISLLTSVGGQIDLDSRGGQAMAQVQESLSTNPQIAAGEITKQAELDAITNTTAATLYNGWVDRVDSDSNPMRAAPMAAMVKLPAVVKNPIISKVVANAAMQEMNEQRIMDNTFAAILTGDLSIEEAAKGVTDFFNTAAGLNNTEGGGLTRYGFKAQTSYNVKLVKPSPSKQLIFNNTNTGSALDMGAALKEHTKMLSLFTKYSVVNLMDQARVTQHFMILRSLHPKEATPNGE
jgi:hypothetical protein